MSDFSSVVNDGLKGFAAQLAESITAHNRILVALAPTWKARLVKEYHEGFVPYAAGEHLCLYDDDATDIYDLSDSYIVAKEGERFAVVIKPFSRHDATNAYLDERGKDRARLRSGAATFARWLERKGHVRLVDDELPFATRWDVSHSNIIERPKEPE